MIQLINATPAPKANPNSNLLNKKKNVCLFKKKKDEKEKHFLGDHRIVRTIQICHNLLIGILHLAPTHTQTHTQTFFFLSVVIPSYSVNTTMQQKDNGSTEDGALQHSTYSSQK